MSALNSREVGECWFTKLDDGRIRIDQADPRIMIAAELLDMMRAGDCDPGVSLDGDIVRIEAVNRTVIYRVGEKAPYHYAYYAEWPD